MNHDESLQLINVISRFQKKLQKTDTAASKKLKILKKLSEIPVNVSILRETGIGKTVNSLRKCDGMLGEQAKELIIQWRDHVNALLVTEEKSKKCSKKEEFIPIHEKNLGTFSNGSKNTFPSEASCFKKAKENFDDISLKQKNDIMHDDHTRTKHKRSFEEMLTLPAVSKVKKKKKKSEFIPKVIEKMAEVKANKLLMPKLPDIELPKCVLDAPKNEYKPLPDPILSKKKTDHHSIEDQDVIIKRGSRGQMYSGKKHTNGVVMTLYQMCMKVLMENINSLYETGGVPFTILEPLLAKCSPSELERLEEYNPHFLEESETLWKTHCQREFKGKEPTSQESWRELFHRLNIEREDRLQRLSTKITNSQAAKAPERSVKLAYIAGVPQITRNQKKTGTGIDSIAQCKLELKKRIEKQTQSEADVSVHFAKLPRKERCSLSVPFSSSQNSPMKSRTEDLGTGSLRYTQKAAKKKGKNPLMAAAIKLLHKQKNRVSSQVIRK